MYWLATLGTFLIAWAAPRLIESASASVPHLLHSLLFLPYPNRLGLLQPTLALGWTLNYEMYFYLAFAVALLMSGGRAAWIACILLAAVAGSIRLAGWTQGVAGFYADPIICEFGFGILVHQTVMRMTPPGTVSGRPAGWRNGLLALAFAAGIALPLQEHFIGVDRTLWAGVPAAVLVLAVVLLEKRCGLAARRGWVVLLGDSSYVLYLIHPYIVYGTIRLFLQPAAMSESGLVLASIALPVLAVIAAVVLHLGVERPLTELLRARLAPQPA
jgi:peptidoglycan/LPS O-acetylase OafA/YrhL